MFNKRIRILLFLSILMALQFRISAQTPAQVHYATFGLGFGARALGMGGAFISIADDITAMSYNPAGLAQLIKPEFSMGVRYGAQSLEYSGFSIIDTSVRYEHDPYTAANYRFMWDYFGGVAPIKLRDMLLVFGFSQSVKGSDKAEYGYLHHYEEFMLPEDSIMTETFERIRVDNRGSITMTTFSLAFRPFEFVHFGYNVNLWNGNVERKTLFQKETLLFYPTVDSYAEASELIISEQFGHGVSHDFGILLKSRNVTAGLVYKTSFKAEFTRTRASTEYIGTLYWPFSFGIGASLRPSEMLTLSIDYNFANWSEGRIVYKDSAEAGYPENNPYDTYQIRFGAEYLIPKRTLAIPVRLGGFISRLFWNDYEGNPIRFWGITGGTGLAMKRFTLDFAAIFNFGSYNSDWLIGASPISVPTRESNWEILLSVSYRLWK